MDGTRRRNGRAGWRPHLRSQDLVRDPAVTRQPVHAKVWIDDRLVFNERLAHPFPIERRITLPPGEQRMILRTWVDRTWSPQIQGSHDSRELGLAVGDWVFQD